MIVRIVRLTLRAEKTTEFLHHFHSVKYSIRNFDGCSCLQLLNEIHRPHVFVTVSHWESEAHLKNYQDSELFRDTWSKVKLLFAEKAEAWSFSEVTGIN